jgi:hypothetical protein
VVVIAAMKLAFPRGKTLVGAVLFGLFQFAGATRTACPPSTSSMTASAAARSTQVTSG